MTGVKEILELIENVDPEDSDTLDEIDARVWCYLERVNFLRITESLKHIEYKYRDSEKVWDCELKELYTRSRDALKRIRPRNVCVRIENVSFSHKVTVDEWACYLVEYPVIGPDMEVHAYAQGMKTEDLAELYAILMADPVRNKSVPRVSMVK